MKLAEMIHLLLLFLYPKTKNTWNNPLKVGERVSKYVKMF